MNRLSELMASAGKNRTRVAADLGVVEKTVQRWQSGQSGIPDDRKLELADMFGVSVAWLMGWDDDANGNGGDTVKAVA